MKEKVRIKSFSKGLVLQLDDQASFDELLSETAAKFLESKTFFGKETVAITFSGRKLSPDEEFQMIDAIQFNCDLKIPCIVEKNDEQDKVFMKAIRQAEIREMIGKDHDSGKDLGMEKNWRLPITLWYLGTCRRDVPFLPRRTYWFSEPYTEPRVPECRMTMAA